MKSILQKTAALCLAFGLSFSLLQAQNCGDTVPELDCFPGTLSICEGEFVALPPLNLGSTLPTIEYVLTRAGVAADDGLGDQVVGSSTTTVFDPSAAPFNLMPNETFRVYPIAYNLADIQALTEDLLNGTFTAGITLPCCVAIGLVVPDFCTNLNAAGYFNGTDIQDLNDVFALVDLFSAVPGSTFSVPGFLASVDGINLSAGGALPATCGASFVPICYATPTLGGSGICTYSILPSSDLACLPLPLGLISFEGEARPWSNLLTWETETESEITSFLIERSMDGIDFHLLEDQAIDLGSETNTFEFIDRQPLNGENYYRLSVKGEEGSVNSSSTIVIKRDDVEVFGIDALAPNPAFDVLNIGIANDLPGVIRIQLVDIHGQVLKQDRIAMPVGITSKEMIVADLPSGVYFISIQKGNETDVQKFFKK